MIHGQVFFGKSAKDIQLGEGSLFNKCSWKKQGIYMQKSEDLKVRAKLIKLRRKQGEMKCFMTLNVAVVT